jgi:hypothetical protein
MGSTLNNAKMMGFELAISPHRITSTRIHQMLTWGIRGMPENRQLIYIPEIEPNTFLLYFKGDSPFTQFSRLLIGST